MKRTARPALEAAQLVAWVKSTQGVDLDPAAAALTIAEMDPALERALDALEGYGIEGEPADFRAVLAARAEPEP